MLCRRPLQLTAALGVALGAATALAQRPIIDIEGAQFQPFPIAVPAFRVEGSPAQSLGQELAAILRNDLALTGLFQVLDPRSFIVASEGEGVTVGTISFQAWLNVGADGLVKVVAEQAGAELRLDVHLFDVVRGREVLHQAFKSSGQPRRLIHKVADAMIAHYTGEGGVMQSRIAYTRRNGSGKDVCAIDVDGYNASCMVQNGTLNLLPAWDGPGALLFTSYMGGSSDLYRVTLGGAAPTVVSKRPGLNTGAAVSPDGKQIALTLSRDGNSEIYLLDHSGANPRRLTNSPWSIDSSPSWSPDGKQIAFVSDRGGSPQIYIMNADGSGVRRLTRQGNYNQTPAWSPRGDRIAFTARDERNKFDVFTVEVATGRIERVTQDQGNNEEPTWSPNGRLLAMVSDRSGRKAIFISDPQGRNQVQVSSGTDACFTPSWSPLIPDLL